MSLIEAGKLNRQIDILSLSSASTRNNYGEQIFTYTTSIAPVWANVQPQLGKGKEDYTDNKPIATNQFIFTIHYTTQLVFDESMVVEYPVGGKRYNINSVVNVDDEDVQINLYCNRVTT